MRVLLVHRSSEEDSTAEEVTVLDNADGGNLRAHADPDSDYDAMMERYPGAVVSNFDDQPGVTEMDALIAYLQVLGTMVDFSTFNADASR